MVEPDGLPTRRLEWRDQRLHRRLRSLTASAATLSPFLTESAGYRGRSGGKRQECSARDPPAAVIVNELKEPVGHCGCPPCSVEAESYFTVVGWRNTERLGTIFKSRSR